MAKPPRNRVPEGPLRVTYHAATRYVQRVLGETVAGGFETTAQEAEAHCAAAGLTLEQVRALIWTDAVACAARHGMKYVHTPDFIATLSPEGSVMTVHVRHVTPRRMKLRSKREQQADYHRFRRRVRRGQSSRQGKD